MQPATTLTARRLVLAQKLMCAKSLDHELMSSTSTSTSHCSAAPFIISSSGSHSAIRTHKLECHDTFSLFLHPFRYYPCFVFDQTGHATVKALKSYVNCNDFPFCPGISWSLEVHQSPPDLIANPGEKAEIQCSHDRTDYRVMLWYQRPLGSTTLKLIGYLNYDKVQMEPSYNEIFTLSGDLTGNKRKEGRLTVRGSAMEQRGEYLCAASSARHLKIPSECYKNFTPHSQAPAATAAPV